MSEFIENNNIKEVDIVSEMKKSYMEYAMSVIVSRALPDVRDGLKPVHRRIIYAMHKSGFTSDKPYNKCAAIVGDVLGKYHPHGDSSVYDALVRLAQEFSTRYMLVDGHGNFGSIDGDSAAAMRYTEAKLSKLSNFLTEDIEKETVEFVDNYNGNHKEPTVLPSKYPNLLVNGSNGIAVGMATSIPPHNLSEVVDALCYMIDNPENDIEDIINIIKGPDFPTGAIIMGKDNIKSAYRTGRGKVRVRAKVTIEEVSKNKEAIIVTEIPYQINKSKLIENIADLVRNKKIEGISELRDESNREGIRIYIELKRDANAQVVLNKLYKHSKLQDTYSIIMLALVNKEPKTLNIKQMLDYYLNHQVQVVTNKTKFELKVAKDKAHILEGYKIALDFIDEVIDIIRNSKDGKEKERLMKRFSLSDIQAQAILDMRLKRLSGLERDKIESEYNELLKQIKGYEDILADINKVYAIIKEDLSKIKSKNSDGRRTQIVHDEEEIDLEDLINKENVLISMTQSGYIKRLPVDTYQAQKRGGKGIKGMNTKEEDIITNIFSTGSHQHLLFFSNKGKVYKIKAYEIPESSRTGKGTNIKNLLYLGADEFINSVLPVEKFEQDKYIAFGTRNGITKKTSLSEYENIPSKGKMAIKLDENDELIDTLMTNGNDDLIFITKKGQSLRTNESNIRNMGRVTRGVKAITLSKENDCVVRMMKVDDTKDLAVININGYGKRTKLSEYPNQNRGGKGLRTYNIKKGDISYAMIVDDSDEIILFDTFGQAIRINSSSIRRTGRDSIGVILFKLALTSHVASGTVVQDLYGDEILDIDNIDE